ncbi:hypothetical protein HO173_000624 [Letharia columbiana]|uniref:F-box domain-containing protein n=1 Tax=Letharia columbiana TaxID=112416 RepID=A0A8H6G7F5_9LECA|nr:uncharacterized protein HO173_000624 [Letharia columbiana]KAF6241912.1 hypothetical protein HO173_000624 [Letharia columbiana]
MSSPQAAVPLPRNPTTIADLPPELITSIYKHLDKPSSITALNSTCRKHYLIWQLNAASISSAVIYDRISGISTAMELLDIQDRIRGVDLSIRNPATGRVLEIQQEARDAVLRDQKSGYRGAAYSNGDYRAILVRNKALISNAKKADHAGTLSTRGASPDRIVSPDDARVPPREEFISAFYRVWMFATLYLGEAMRARLGSMEVTQLEDMMAVVQFLVYDCPVDDKVYLGVSRRWKPRPIEFGYGTEPDKCNFDWGWMGAFFSISGAYGGLAGAHMIVAIGHSVTGD